jgi:indole-3-glycerol phosphate synthase
LNDILSRIVEATREDLRDEWVDWKAVTRAARSRSETKPRYSFRSAISANGGSPRVIAEIKAASPSAGVIAANPDVPAISSAYRKGGAAAISVVTEPHFFAGSRDWLYRAGKASGLPVIMKDFIVEPVQIFRGIAAGADAVLLLASILETMKLQEFLGIVDELGRDAVVEVHDEEELLRALTPVELEMMQGVLNANRLEIVDSGDLVRFLGGVRMTVMLNGEPLVTPVSKNGGGAQ